MREHPTYKKLLADYRVSAIKINHNSPGQNPLQELDDLMMTSYRLQKFIKANLNSSSVGGKFVVVPSFGDAFKYAQKVTNQSKGIHSLYVETEALEALSRATYKLLKLNQILRYD